jgi:predicted CXXCH cytochrome family protein
MNRTMLRLCFLLVLGCWSAGAVIAEDKCLTCHETLGDTPSTLFKHDIHRTKGITCAGCHGGNANSDEMDQAMDKSAGFIGVPKGDQISQVCAKCHSDAERMQQLHALVPTGQLERLEKSVHGSLATNGRERIAQCSTCHNAHGIVSVKNPASPVYALNVVKTCAKCHANAAYMRTYNPSLPVDQLDKYRTSVHGMRNAKGDHKVAECASCHGSHDILSVKDVKAPVYPTNIPSTCSKCHSDAQYMKEYKIPTDQLVKFSKSVHGIALLTKGDISAPACNSCHGNHGATPPGVSSVSNVCGTCHALNAELFSSSPHKKAFDARKLPECETCHSNHEIIVATNKLLGVTPGAVCSRCHTPTENAAGYAVARVMRTLVDSLATAENEAITLVNEAEQKGMEVTDARFKLRDAHQARLQSRTMVHSFDEGKLRGVVVKGLDATAFASSEARGALDEYVFRRIGLGIATLIITILAISLYVYIRRLERRQRSGEKDTPSFPQH